MIIPTKEELEQADRLQFWASHGEVGGSDEGQTDTDAVLEWLGDEGCLNEKGKAVAHAFWYRFMYDDDSEQNGD